MNCRRSIDTIFTFLQTDDAHLIARDIFPELDVHLRNEAFEVERDIVTIVCSRHLLGCIHILKLRRVVITGHERTIGDFQYIGITILFHICAIHIGDYLIISIRADIGGIGIEAGVSCTLVPIFQILLGVVRLIGARKGLSGIGAEILILTQTFVHPVGHAICYARLIARRSSRLLIAEILVKIAYKIVREDPVHLVRRFIPEHAEVVVAGILE